MFVTKKHISRRAVLRGAVGLTVGLPLLDAMVPAARAAPPPQLRFGAVYVPNGVRPEIWTPPLGPNLTLPPLLARFEPVRDRVNIVTGLCSSPQSEHHSATSLWLHGGFLRKTEGADVRNVQTFDQHVADAIGQDTALPSLELGIEDMSGSPGSCAFGFSCIYMNTLSWRTPTAPLPMELNPQTVFERLFGDSGTQEQRAARWREKASVLDSVLAAARSLNAELGPEDRVTIDEYLDNVREVERRIQLAERQIDSGIDLPAAPTGVPSSYEEHVKLMYDLVALAFRADVTRVFTFMKGVEASPINYPQIGVPESHHIVSHHENKPEAQQKYAKINAYHLGLLADFVERLRATRDGDGSLLDHSLLLYGSGMGNGNVHDHRKLPIMLAGGAAGRLQGGRHIANPDPTPMANLIASLGDVAGVELDGLENATGRVAL
ncbi:MAG TPA: DUF1552 domain-containing protein [Gammaproteobacteria bacterium]|nr:DUF1552 domain-containing protein [Gammaproteobacteria bacterium]